MKTFFLIRNIFRGILLTSLLFRLFIVEKLNSYSWDVISYSLLVLGLGGMITLDIFIYVQKKKGKL